MSRNFARLVSSFWVKVTYQNGEIYAPRTRETSQSRIHPMAGVRLVVRQWASTTPNRILLEVAAVLALQQPLDSHLQLLGLRYVHWSLLLEAFVKVRWLITALKVGGSIVGPSQRSNIIGIKPTVGLTSRDLVFMSKRQGTVGTMARTLEDAASLLEVIAGKCPNDADTSAIPFEQIPKYASFCDKSALKGARIGIPRNAFRDSDGVVADKIELAGIDKAVSIMEDAGAEIIDPANYPQYETFLSEAGPLRGRIGFADWKADMARYVKNLVDNPQNINNIHDLVEFTKSCPEEEYPSRDVAGLVGISEAIAQDDPRVEEAWERVRELAVEGGINGAIKKHNLDALIMPSSVSTSVATVARAPIITVPLGFYPEGTEVVWNGRRNLVLQDKNLP